MNYSAAEDEIYVWQFTATATVTATDESDNSFCLFVIVSARPQSSAASETESEMYHRLHMSEMVNKPITEEDNPVFTLVNRRQITS